MTRPVIEFEERKGFLYMLKCPDCHHKTTALVRTDQRQAGVKARICENFACWRFTDLSAVAGWDKAYFEPLRKGQVAIPE